MRRKRSSRGMALSGFPMLAGTPDPPEVRELMKRVTIIPPHQMTYLVRGSRREFICDVN